MCKPCNWRSPEWRRRREERLKENVARFGRLTCEGCRRHDWFEPHVHHRGYDWPCGLEPSEALEVLCFSCHNKRHPNEKPFPMPLSEFKLAVLEDPEHVQKMIAGAPPPPDIPLSAYL
jgi:hypothetical protein